MKDLYLLLGSNLGDRLAVLKAAVERLSEKLGDVQSLSAVYETAAWGKTDQPNFYNQAIFLRTVIDDPQAILETVLSIERDLGRLRKERWAERMIDIDVLFIDQLTIDTPTLRVPHQELINRRFALVPLADIAPNLLHPEFNMSVAELLRVCPDLLKVKRLPQ